MITPLANDLLFQPTICMEIGMDRESLIASLEATGTYRVLRRLLPRPYLTPPDANPTKLGLFLDLETTGLDPLNDEIIEIPMLPFTYGPDGRIYEVREPFQRLRQPSKPIPLEITELTGITDIKTMDGFAYLAVVIDLFSRRIIGWSL